MMLRTVTAQWFELLTSRDELSAALDCLARTQSVQLQAYSQTESRLPMRDLRTRARRLRNAGAPLCAVVARRASCTRSTPSMR